MVGSTMFVPIELSSNGHRITLLAYFRNIVCALYSKNPAGVHEAIQDMVENELRTPLKDRCGFHRLCKVLTQGVVGISLKSAQTMMDDPLYHVFCITDDELNIIVSKKHREESWHQAFCPADNLYRLICYKAGKGVGKQTVAQLHSQRLRLCATLTPKNAIKDKFPSQGNPRKRLATDHVDTSNPDPSPCVTSLAPSPSHELSPSNGFQAIRPDPDAAIHSNSTVQRSPRRMLETASQENTCRIDVIYDTDRALQEQATLTSMKTHLDADRDNIKATEAKLDERTTKLDQKEAKLVADEADLARRKRREDERQRENVQAAGLLALQQKKIDDLEAFNLQKAAHITEQAEHQTQKNVEIAGRYQILEEREAKLEQERQEFETRRIRWEKERTAAQAIARTAVEALKSLTATNSDL
ncbi:hypothetical protein HJFPF1_00325 [Paramyrothecium foliicola]|nr:hypothetical protein HJFPF1_00325 [Paramyrothecium foliicola]